MNTPAPALSTFKFAPGLDLRVIDRDGSPWFVAKDVCAALSLPGYASIHTKNLDANEVQLLTKSQLAESSHARLFAHKAPNVALISESGLYSLILRSRKPEARAFKKWVTSEVLPTIRKTGGYMTPAVAQMAVEDPAVFMARALVIANEVVTGLKTRAKGLEATAPETVLMRDWLQTVGLTHLTRAQRASIGARARTLSDVAGRPREYQAESVRTVHGSMTASRVLWLFKSV